MFNSLPTTHQKELLLKYASEFLIVFCFVLFFLFGRMNRTRNSLLSKYKMIFKFQFFIDHHTDLIDKCRISLLVLKRFEGAVKDQAVRCSLLISPRVLWKKNIFSTTTLFISFL